MRLGVSIDIGIGVHPLRIALGRIRREEHAHHRVVVARVEVV